MMIWAPDPLDEPCDACNAEPGEECHWPCTAHAAALAEILDEMEHEK